MHLAANILVCLSAAVSYLIYTSAAINYLVCMRADDEHGRLGSVHLYGAEPEVEAGVLVAQANVPQQHVHRAIRQKELQP